MAVVVVIVYPGLVVQSGTSVESHEVREDSLPLIESVVLLTPQSSCQNPHQPLTLTTFLLQRRGEGELLLLEIKPPGSMERFHTREI